MRPAIAFMVVCVGLIGSTGPLWADAAADEVAREWAAKEATATTPKAKGQLAKDLFAAAEKELSSGGPATRPAKVSAKDRQRKLAQLSPEQKARILALCRKASQIGAQVPEGYVPAAGALGLIQELDPAQRLDCLTTLEKMYKTAYEMNPARNLGMAQGLADVRLQIGQERWAQLQARQAQPGAAVEDIAAALPPILQAYDGGLAIITTAIGRIKPYVGNNKQGQDFVAACEEIQAGLQRGLTDVAATQRFAADWQRVLRIKSDMDTRLKKDPQDQAAAERLVRLSINEFDDWPAARLYGEIASPATRDLLALAQKPPGLLGVADALALARWFEKLDDNPQSRNHQGMLLRARVYYERVGAAAPADSPDARSAILALKKIHTDLAALHVPDDKATELCTAIVASLTPPAPPATQVAVVPPPAPDPAAPPVGPPAPPPPSPPPVKPPPEPVAVKTAAPLVAPAPARPDEEAPSKRGSIFDFGREGL